MFSADHSVRESHPTSANRRDTRILRAAKISRRVHDALLGGNGGRHNGGDRGIAERDIRRSGALAERSSGAEELKGIQSFISGLFVIQHSTRGALIGQLRYVNLQGLAKTT